MKKILAILLLMASSLTLAQVITYSNDDGCMVEVEKRRNGVVLYITKGAKQEVVGYGNDYTFGDFVYCADEKTDINSFEGSQGTHIMISCSEHQNGHKTTRGRVDISIMGGELSEIKIDGQVKGLFGWKQDSKIECSNLLLDN